MDLGKSYILHMAIDSTNCGAFLHRTNNTLLFPYVVMVDSASSLPSYPSSVLCLLITPITLLRRYDLVMCAYIPGLPTTYSTTMTANGTLH